MVGAQICFDNLGINNLFRWNVKLHGGFWPLIDMNRGLQCATHQSYCVELSILISNINL